MANPTNKALPAITGEIHYESPVLQLPPIISPWKIPILSYTSSLVSTTLGFPLDSIKTRMQAYRYSSAWKCFMITVNNEGFRGLFRGIMTPLITSSISKSTGVSIYSHCKPIVAEYTSMRSSQAINNFCQAFIAGNISGAAVCLFACPFEMTKIFQQIVLVINKESSMGIQRQLLPTTVREVFYNIVKYDGIFGLYSGFKYHLLRDSFSTGLFFATYESTKMLLQEYIPGIGMFSVPLSGILAGVTSWITVFPIDTMKSQYQRDVVRNIIRVKSGLERLPLKKGKWTLPKRDLYRGLGPSITKSVCTTTIFFSGFEYLMKHIE